jgi:fructose-1,6-bisphosphatase I
MPGYRLAHRRGTPMAVPISAEPPGLERSHDVVTLERHLLSIECADEGATGALAWVLSSFGLCARMITHKLKRARLEDVLGEIGRQNVQGERQQKLDVIANRILMQILSGRDGVVVLGSEEDEDLVYADSPGLGGQRFAVFFDPLDGSGNLDVAGGVGTIFSVYRLDGAVAGGHRLRPGREQEAAGYFLYGSSTLLVLAAAGEVSMFVLDPDTGAFVRVMQRLRIPARGSVYSVNEANLETFPEGYRRYIADCHVGGISARYAGAMVADVHRVLLKGGVFLYPPTAAAPNGKLRLMYECNPMAKIVTDAGGAAETGSGAVLDVDPSALHQRVPVIIGSPENVSDVLARL